MMVLLLSSLLVLLGGWSAAAAATESASATTSTGAADEGALLWWRHTTSRSRRTATTTGQQARSPSTSTSTSRRLQDDALLTVSEFCSNLEDVEESLTNDHKQLLEDIDTDPENKFEIVSSNKQYECGCIFNNSDADDDDQGTLLELRCLLLYSMEHAPTQIKQYGSSYEVMKFELLQQGDNRYYVPVHSSFCDTSHGYKQCEEYELISTPRQPPPSSTEQEEEEEEADASTTTTTTTPTLGPTIDSCTYLEENTFRNRVFLCSVCDDDRQTVKVTEIDFEAVDDTDGDSENGGTTSSSSAQLQSIITCDHEDTGGSLLYKYSLYNNMQFLANDDKENDGSSSSSEGAADNNNYCDPSLSTVDDFCNDISISIMESALTNRFKEETMKPNKITSSSESYTCKCIGGGRRNPAPLRVECILTYVRPSNSQGEEEEFVEVTNTEYINFDQEQQQVLVPSEMGWIETGRNGTERNIETGETVTFCLGRQDALCSCNINSYDGSDDSVTSTVACELCSDDNGLSIGYYDTNEASATLCGSTGSPAKKDSSHSGPLSLIFRETKLNVDGCTPRSSSSRNYYSSNYISPMLVMFGSSILLMLGMAL